MDLCVKKRKRQIQGPDVFERVEFGADPNKNLDSADLNVVSVGDLGGSCDTSMLVLILQIKLLWIKFFTFQLGGGALHRLLQ